ncbi:MAG: AAA family ATPase [Lachnospiraceae bacterium]|nr:AAA family ATPase [Lachnospiraceae bacterium]
MNIKEVKEEIRRSVEIYLDKNEFGEYNIPYMKQRPIFMVGAPGIGKTAIMEQIASELNLALVSYSMTHHTRQSAIGLPYIEEKTYNGQKVMVSEYTMSEIIASVYDVIERSGVQEGILFLDEINCVSETLAPSMLLFLQYKTFGNRKLPEGWVVVTAGNLPQYNKSVKEFDVATMDRLKCLTIEEDFGVWKAYAYQHGIHAAVISFLEVNPDWFYSIRTTVDGTQYVTARGWEDLSRAVQLYEKKQFCVDRNLIQQYVTDVEIARKFGIYYDLYKKYQTDYRVSDILSGTSTGELIKRAGESSFDERVSLLGMIYENLNLRFRKSVETERILQTVVKFLRSVKKKSADGEEEVISLLEGCVNTLQEEQNRKAMANSLSSSQKREYQEAIHCLRDYQEICVTAPEKEKQFPMIKKKFDSQAKRHKKQVEASKDALEHVFRFVEAAWGEEQEMLLFMTNLTANAVSMEFIANWGSKSYFQHNQELLIYDVHGELQKQIEQLEW